MKKLSVEDLKAGQTFLFRYPKDYDKAYVVKIQRVSDSHISGDWKNLESKHVFYGHTIYTASLKEAVESGRTIIYKLDTLKNLKKFL